MTGPVVYYRVESDGCLLRLSHFRFAFPSYACCLGVFMVSSSLNTMKRQWTLSIIPKWRGAVTSRRTCVSASSALEQWFLKAQENIHGLETASLSSSSAISPKDENARQQRRITLADAASNNIETLLQSAPSVISAAASSILVSGADLKAIIPDGALSCLAMEAKDLSRADLTGMSLVGTSGTRCDFSRCLMYRVAFHQSRFEACVFDGAILKANSIMPSTPADQSDYGNSSLQSQENSRGFLSVSPVFRGCSFKFCMLDITELRLCNPSSGKPIPKGDWSSHGYPIFENCDFEYSEIRCNEGCGWMFRQCRNVPRFTLVEDGNTPRRR
jgi:uncharacterized protein YjbI with pentapeptide repeats